MTTPVIDWDRFEAWLAVERTQRHVVPGFEHAAFFLWRRLGSPAAAEVVATLATPAEPVRVEAPPAPPPPPPAPRPAPTAPAAPRQQPRPAPDQMQLF